MSARREHLARWVAVAVVPVVLFVADVTHACPGCASPREENRQAFVDTTVFLTVLPLLMIGGFIWWLRRRAKRLHGGRFPLSET